MCAKMYEDNKYVYSGLMTGTMWDMVLVFISNKVLSGDYSEVLNTPWENYGSTTLTNLKGQFIQVNGDNSATYTAIKVTETQNKSRYGILTTASTEDTKKNNIYDLAGNLWEWTQEACWAIDTTERYLLRGGSFQNSLPSNWPVCYRGISNSTWSLTYHGFRPVILIK